MPYRALLRPACLLLLMLPVLAQARDVPAPATHVDADGP